MTEKTIEKTMTVKETIYEAIDGTIFNSKEECKKYDETGEAIVKARFLAFSKDENRNSEAYNAIVSTEIITADYKVYRSTPKTQDDCDTIARIVAQEGGTTIIESTPSTWYALNSCEIVPNETYLVCVQDWYGCVLSEKKLLDYLTKNVKLAFNGSIEPKKEEKKEEETK